MSRRNLNATCSKILIYIGIRNNRNLPVRQWKLEHLAHDILISFILRVDCHSGIAKQCLRTCRSYLNEAVLALDRIPYMPEEARLILILNLRIRECGKASRTPVYYSVAAIDESFII